MSARRHLNQQQFKGLYHGTAGYDLKPGDILTPDQAAQHTNFDFSEPGKLYAHASLETAREYAETHYNRQFGAEPTVYKVHPLGPTEQDSNARYVRQSRQTSHPMKIIRKMT